MDRVTIDFSLPNFITIGLIAALWYAVIVGGWSLWSAKSSPRFRWIAHAS